MDRAVPMSCPSAECRPGSVLLGIVLPNGRVAFSRDKVVIDAAFVEAAHEGRPPEQRFRFAGSCVESGCRQWAGHGCGLIDRLVSEGADEPPPPSLPNCSVRDSCRWYDQHRHRACAVCPEVVTDGMAELPPQVHRKRQAMRHTSGNGANAKPDPAR